MRKTISSFIRIGTGIAGAVLLSLLLLYMIQENLIFYPDRIQDDYRFEFPWKFDEKNFETAPGVRINALHFRTEGKSKGVIFYLHGNAGSLKSWGWVAEDFVPRGWDLLIIDYRTYGKSKGRLSETALYQDAQFIYQELLREDQEEHIIVFGRSLGTGIATKIAADNNPKQLILETPFYNFADLIQSIYPALPMWMLSYHFPNDQHLKSVKCPVVMLHGTQDEIVYYKSSEKLLKHISSKAELVPVTGGSHNDLRNFPEYQAALDRILK
ncbi:MAG: alpha/beta hydrolase [Bacteroidia bacterium]